MMEKMLFRSKLLLIHNFNDEQILDSDSAFNSFIDFVSEHERKAVIEVI